MQPCFIYTHAHTQNWKRTHLLFLSPTLNCCLLERRWGKWKLFTLAAWKNPLRLPRPPAPLRGALQRQTNWIWRVALRKLKSIEWPNESFAKRRLSMEPACPAFNVILKHLRCLSGWCWDWGGLATLRHFIQIILSFNLFYFFKMLEFHSSLLFISICFLLLCSPAPV